MSADTDRMLRSLLREPAPTPTEGLRRALAEIATTPQQRHRWLRRPGWLGLGPSARMIRLAVAAVIVALVGGLLLDEALTPRRTDEPLPAVMPAASPTARPPGLPPIVTHRYQSTSFPGAGPLPPEAAVGPYDPGRYQVIRGSSPFSFAVPSAGWTSDGVSTVTRSADGASVRYWTALPDSIYADPCAGDAIWPLADAGKPPVEVLSMLPDTILVSVPSEVVVAGIVTSQFVLTVPEDGSCAGGFQLWSDAAPDGRPEPRPGDTISLWIGWAGPEYLFIEGRTPQAAGPGIDPEVAAIVASTTVPEDPIFPPAELNLGGGEYRWDAGRGNGWGYSTVTFRNPSSAWRSTGYDDVGNGGGSLVRGEAGTPSGAVVTFSRPDQVYADPCAHTLQDPPPGPSIDDFAAALAAIPGTDLLSGPTDVTFSRRAAIELVLRVREDIGCEPEDFYLWADECVTTRTWHERGADGHEDRLCLEHPDPRAARARGSTIRLWVVRSRAEQGFPLFALIDAETYEGATPEVEREVQQLIDSIVTLGYRMGSG
jgi:hypothetical protein